MKLKSGPFKNSWKNHVCLKAFGATVLLFTLGFSLFRPYFLTNDDALLTLLAKGVGVAHQPSEFLLFLNILVGWGLKGLYSWAPAVAWYGLFLYTGYFLSVWAFLAVLFPRFQNPRVRPAALVVLLPFFFHFFALPQYTAVAILAAQAGIFLFLIGKSGHRGSFIAGAGLLFFGGLIRPEPVYLSLLLAIPLWLSVRDRNKKKSKYPPPRRQDAKKGPSRIKLKPPKMNFDIFDKNDERRRIFFLALVCFLAFLLLDGIVYRLNPKWQEARAYVAASFRLIEVKMPDYGANEAAFRSAGWSPIDYAMFIRRFWLDPKFDIEKVEQLSVTLPYNPLFKFQHWAPSVLFPPNFLSIAAFLLLLPWVGRGKRWVPAGTFALFIGLSLLLVVFGKVPEWVLLPEFLFTVMVCLFHFNEPARGKVWTAPFILALSVLLAMGSLALKHEYSGNQARQKTEGLMVDSIVKLSPQPNQLFVAWNGQLPVEDISVFGNWELFKGFNLLWFSWADKTPPVRETLTRFHMEEPLMDMVGRPDVFFIYDPGQSEIYQRFMMENAGIAVSPEPLFQGPLFSVYRMRNPTKGD